MWTADFCFEQFKQARAGIAAAEGTNEATTRLRAIDLLLFQVLGWDRSQVDAERYCRSEGFADYAFTESGRLSLVLEAKKADATFMLPKNHFSAKPVGFALLAKECPNADVALRQALGYAASLGARYIAISNGFQWILALTFVASQPVNDRSVLVFESIDAIETRFRLFFDCFSPSGIAENRPLDSLLEQRMAPPPSKLSQRLPVYPLPARRNQISNELSTVLGTVWEEVRDDEEDPDFLQECYVEPEANAGGLALAHELINQRLSSDERLFSRSIDASGAADVVSLASPEKPIVVLGNVGNGKTTFLHYLRLVRAKDSCESIYRST